MSTPFLGELRIISWNYAPKGWAFANGQLLPINQNQALFSLFGTTYGGDGRVNFALPDLRSRVALHFGSNFTLGERGGQESHTITTAEMPAHNHLMMANNTAGLAATAANSTPAANKVLAPAVAAKQGGGTQNVNIYGNGAANTTLNPASVTNTGGSQPHQNLQPYTVLNVIVALQGIFPSQN